MSLRPIAIRLTGRAYLPEAHAYARYLRERGMEARLVGANEDLAPEEIAILFSARDFLDRSIKAVRVHEYHSLSTGRIRWLKDMLRVRAAAPADGLILQEGPSLDRFGPRLGKNELKFVRPMGIDAAIFDCARAPDRKIDFDLVYCGSLSRAGLAPMLDMLASKGFRIACYGHVPDKFPAKTLKAKGVRFFGAIDRAAVPEALATAKAGLNWMPDIPPFNIQESTKTVEYAAAGLPTLSNRYAWADAFAAMKGSGVHWLDAISGPEQLDALSPASLDLTAREWTRLLDERGFLDFLARVSDGHPA